jgi:hypothetical protein
MATKPLYNNCEFATILAWSNPSLFPTKFHLRGGSEALLNKENRTERRK